MGSIIDWNLGDALAAGVAAKKVIKTVPKVDTVTSAAAVPDVKAVKMEAAVKKVVETVPTLDAITSAAAVPDVEAVKVAEADENGDKNSENKESPQREHDDTDYDSDGLE